MQDESEFLIDKTNIIETDNYIVHVGTVPGDKVPQYLVFNKEFGVLEFAHNMIYFVKEALAEMEEKLVQQELEANAETPAEESTPKKSTKKRVVN